MYWRAPDAGFFDRVFSSRMEAWRATTVVTSEGTHSSRPRSPGTRSVFSSTFTRLRARPSILRRACAARASLTRVAWDRSTALFPFEAASHLAYFFDCGIIIRGLLSAWRVTQEPEFLDTALQTGQAMRRHFLTPRAIHPILTLPDCQPRAYEPRWSASPGCYQLKSAMAWHDLFEVTGDRDLLEAYECAVAQALETQDSFLPGEADRAKVMDRLHAYAYFLEGLLPRGENPAGISKLAGYLREIAPLFARSDVYAQTLRLRLYAADPDREAAAQEAEAAASFQMESDDPRIDGAFCFGSRCGKLLPFANPVSTAFCTQALILWEQKKAARRDLI